MKHRFVRTIAALAASILACGIATAQTAKPIVAVVRIDDLTNSGQSANLTAMIESAVASTGRFRLMERERMGKLVSEQTRAAGGMVTTNRPGKVGGFEGVDYLVYGSITALSSKSGADAAGNLIHGLLGNKNAGCNERSVTLGLDVKITDADTGEIRYVNRLDETQNNSACGGQAQIDATALLRSAAQKIATGLVTSIWPIQVAAVMPDGAVVLNYGEGSVTAGQTMVLFAKGAEIRDPTTGEVLDSASVPLGLIKVVSVTPRTARAMPASAFTAAIPVGTLVRVASKDDVRTLGKRK